MEFNFLHNAKLILYLFGYLSDYYFVQGTKSGNDIIRKYITVAINGLEYLGGFIGLHSGWEQLCCIIFIYQMKKTLTSCLLLNR